VLLSRLSKAVARVSPASLFDAYRVSKGEALLARWWQGTPNWGDSINPILIEKIAGRPVLSASHTLNFSRRPVISAVGSVLDDADELNLCVWGSGFKFSDGRMKAPPRKVHAVRGPLSRKLLLDQSIDCPEVFGDPALLFPTLFGAFSPMRDFAIGIVPHFNDRDSPILASPQFQNCVNIDVGLEPFAFMDLISRCQLIVSSSLHGIIAADSLGIPSLRAVLGDRVLGGDFKFNDYYLSTGKIRPSIYLSETTTLSEIEDLAFRGGISIDLEQLLAAFPHEQ